ncbi:hypothetical protein NPS01_39360 [Nocardioides psychrotolerans]|uniref:Uncharacterized protein n=1 Tax=Nocardioides psychrotolerans TaxID=1005945 RepID=A0A1I3QYV7_9ACTN|nr:hypothetical protein [Nocardioides psychrotolerans]GEP40273.1 hypothetical protein NPS01_39360 [Nocardioides psychrotolerans]SFJ38337.1 hypothetical protein SAMN05216561_12819 [Nocardioides psychrotolerans]
MRFTEHEMTVAVDTVARRLHAATRPPWRRGDAVAAYDGLERMKKWRLKVTAGEVVLPVLTALPERPTVGAKPEFTEAELTAAAQTAGRDVMEHRKPGAWDAMPAKRRDRVLATAVELTRVAVDGMPVRQDPDALIVPDHL